MQQPILDTLTNLFEDHIEDALEAAHDAYGDAVEKYGAHTYGLQMAQTIADAALLDHLRLQVKGKLDFGSDS